MEADWPYTTAGLAHINDCNITVTLLCVPKGRTKRGWPKNSGEKNKAGWNLGLSYKEQLIIHSGVLCKDPIWHLVLKEISNRYRYCKPCCWIICCNISSGTSSPFLIAFVLTSITFLPVSRKNWTALITRHWKGYWKTFHWKMKKKHI